MHTQVQKWGNSLGIRIPKNLAKKLNLYSGSQIELSAKDHHLIITKSDSELDLLLNRINTNNCHHETFNDDNSVGRETW
jgi:antitoxin MazE